MFQSPMKVVAALTLVLLLVAAVWFRVQNANRLPEAAEVSAVTPLNCPSGDCATPPLPSPLTRVTTIELQQFVTEEARAIGRLDEANEESERRLDEMASRLEPEGMAWLSARALDRELPEDDRFLAADLLARSYDRLVLGSLERLVTAPFEEVRDPENTRGTVEWLVRARALEGFENFASGEFREEAAQRLRNISARLGSSFLAERSASILRRLQDPAAKTLEEEDAEKLSETLAR